MLKCVLMVHGAVYVMTIGITMMLVLSVDNWDSLQKVQ